MNDAGPPPDTNRFQIKSKEREDEEERSEERSEEGYKCAVM